MRINQTQKIYKFVKVIYGDEKYEKNLNYCSLFFYGIQYFDFCSELCILK